MQKTVNDYETFCIIQIENTAYCNRKCKWCPQSNLQFTPDQTMAWDTLEMIVKNLVDINYTNRVHPYGNGEPLTDDDFLERIKFIRKNLPEAWIYISTNGDLVNKKFTFSEMLDAGINSIQCNHYDDKNESLKCEYYPHVEHYNIGMLRTNFYNRAGNIKLANITPATTCWFPGKKLYFNYLGDMLVCCADWTFRDVIGNIHKESLSELLEEPKLKDYKDKLAEGKSSELKLCSQCNLIKH